MKKNWSTLIIVLLCASTYTRITNRPTDKKSTQQPAPLEQYDRLVYKWSRTFAEMWQLTNQKHYHVKPDKLEEAMITSLNAFMASIDPHAGVLSPKTYKAMLESTQGEFVGIGIVIDNTRKTKDKFLTMVDVVPDGPADKAGLKPLDKIIEVEGQQLEGMSTEEIITKIKGERKTKVHIKILRDKEKDLLSFDITRDTVKDQNALSFYLPDHHIYYLSLNMFSENAVKQIEELLNKAKEQKYRALILDLRNNSGGLLDAVIEIVGMFVPKGSTVVFTKDKDNKETARYRTQREPVTKKLPPIFVLTNNYTASAAEILTGCLKIHASQAKNGNLMAFLVGTDTFGKGTVQEVMPISNNCAIKLTTALYYLPDNNTIQGTGITPDFVIERTFGPTEQMQWFTKYYGRERALSNYIKAPGAQDSDQKKGKKASKKTEHKRWEDRVKELLQTDNQLRQTISLVNLLHTAHKLCPDRVCSRDQALQFMHQNFITDGELAIQAVKS